MAEKATPEEIAKWADHFAAGRAFKHLTAPALGDLLHLSERTVRRYEDPDDLRSWPKRAMRNELIRILELRHDWFEMPMSRQEVLEAAEAEERPDRAADTAASQGTSRKAIEKAKHAARRSEQEQAD